MPAPVSVIIPTLNVAGILGPCLGSVAAGLEQGIIAELVLADGGSKDDIKKIADLADAVFVLGPTGRGSQLRKGASMARAEWLLFLHADTVLEKSWPTYVMRHIADNPNKAAYFKLRFDSISLAAKIVAGWANLRSRLFGLPYGDQGLLISRTLYDQIGGYADIPLMEDVRIAKALSGKIVGLNCLATTSAARYQQSGWLRRGIRNIGILLRYKMGADPVELAKKYRR